MGTQIAYILYTSVLVSWKLGSVKNNKQLPNIHDNIKISFLTKHTEEEKNIRKQFYSGLSLHRTIQFLKGYIFYTIGHFFLCTRAMLVLTRAVFVTEVCKSLFQRFSKLLSFCGHSFLIGFEALNLLFWYKVPFIFIHATWFLWGENDTSV